MNLYKKFLIQTYNIGIIKKPIGKILSNGIGKGDIVWLKHSFKDRFFADPFMIKEDKDYYYILVEEFLFWEEKGKITLLKIKKVDFSLVERKIVIEEPTHLSFPFCELNGTTIVPESVLSGKTKEYSIDLDTMTIVNRREILNEGLIDAAFYTDRQGNKWILAAKMNNPKEDMYMYLLNAENYEPIKNGNVIAHSIEETRSAGRLFEFEGNLYRPVQDSIQRYGRQTRIMRIDKLDKEEYKANCVQVINGKDNPPYNETLHTFNVYDDCVIVDGSKDYFRFPMKILYKKCRWLFKKK